mmetsp:Transcript_19365/g.61452  ORF Transcript_19365/g.61452 Transcript_19365/m.61452 type:complete len:228 (+) Transcript_19365:653-1336(+)
MRTVSLPCELEDTSWRVSLIMASVRGATLPSMEPFHWWMACVPCKNGARSRASASGLWTNVSDRHVNIRRPPGLSACASAECISSAQVHSVHISTRVRPRKRVPRMSLPAGSCCALAHGVSRAPKRRGRVLANLRRHQLLPKVFKATSRPSLTTRMTEARGKMEPMVLSWYMASGSFHAHARAGAQAARTPAETGWMQFPPVLSAFGLHWLFAPVVADANNRKHCSR